jgi:DNA polymerase-1
VTARRLIERFGHLEDIYRHIEDIPTAAVQKRLREQREQAVLSKELAILTMKVPLDFSLDAMRVREPDVEKLMGLFTEYELKRPAAELMDQRPAAPEAAAQVITIGSDGDTGQLTETVRRTGAFAFLFGPGRAEDMWGGGDMFLCGPEGPVWQVVEDRILDLAPLFEDSGLRKVTDESKDALKRLGTLGCPVNGDIFDVGLAAFLLAPSRAASGIADLGWQYFREMLPENPDGPRLVRLVSRLAAPLSDELKAHDLERLFTEIELPLARVLCAMEQEGVRIDAELLGRLSGECNRRILELHQEIFRLAGEEFNLNSPKQLGAVLFGKLKQPVLKKTKTGNSTNEEVLVRLAARHPVPALILEYRQLAKLKSTYIDALPKLADPSTGKVHATFNQSGAETGRLSSSNPNLQNIPIRTDLGREIRKAFIPSRPGGLILSADYSQIELRILAHLSGDENLLYAFTHGEDIHAFTAAQIFDVPEKEVTAEMRGSAKRVNFGIIYGMSAFGLAKDLNISQPEAAAFIDRYFLRYPRVKSFMDRQIEECEARGYVTTLLNRRRYLPDILSGNIAVRQFAQRQAINTPVQGTAADMIKLAMIRIFDEINRRRLNARMIITVHDELVFDLPAEEKEILVTLVRQQMEHTLELKVPVTVTVGCGPNWLETKRI